MTTLRLTQNGLQQVPTSGIMVFLAGNKPLSGALDHNRKMRFHRGNCAAARPFIFKTIELAIEAISQIENASNKARFFIGNQWIGEMKAGEITMFEKPIMQLL